MAPRVLLLDDEPDLLHALSVRLTAAGLTCETAHTGTEAMAKIQSARPDLIITDLIMPEVDGFAMVRWLQRAPHTATIPVIVLTAMPKHAIDPTPQELQATHILHKPFDFQELLSLTRALLATRIPGGPSHG